MRRPDDSRRNTIQGTRARFAGPFQTAVIDNLDEKYSNAVWWAIGIGFSHVLIGSLLMVIYLYSIQKGDLHAVIFSMAYNFFAAEAILSLSFVNGWATPIRSMHRKYVHIFLQLCTIITAVSGMIIVARKLQFQRTAHSVLGLLTLLLTLLSSLTGPFALKLVVRKGHFVHMSCGILCFCSSMICLFTGLLKQDLKRWTGQDVVYMLNLFITFYSSLIVITTITKVVNKG
ncbi:unnamed protein product [Spodoptera littoralis]|uniref:ascorbate ferrireductase (transmembrane) n=1 Tax=Spodoptera littoralis TaxID=7109 RepID=A0A9N8KX53_SPOLI|nr:unnamed protein product [Spodoptera littoralis]CAD0226377.1 unnamed protein product [Spodoptera littoralis]